MRWDHQSNRDRKRGLGAYTAIQTTKIYLIGRLCRTLSVPQPRFRPRDPLFSSVQDGIYALGKADAYCAPLRLSEVPQRCLSNSSMFVWLIMALARPFKEDPLWPGSLRPVHVQMCRQSDQGRLFKGEPKDLNYQHKLTVDSQCSPGWKRTSSNSIK